MKKLILGALLGLSLITITGCGSENTVNDNTEGWNSEVECVVKDKWVKRSEGDDKYLVSCDNDVYQITDNLFYGKFNSSDIYAGLQVGKKYRLQVSGFRFGLTSSYKNINEITLIENNGE